MTEFKIQAEQNGVATTDHDLLIRIDTRLTDLIRENGDFKTNLGKLNSEKCDKADMADNNKTTEKKLTDFEIRMRRLERIAYLAIGGLFILEFLLNK